MTTKKLVLVILAICLATASCSVHNFLKGGLHAEMDDSLSIVRLITDPERYLDKEIVFSVRYYKKADKKTGLPCPLGDGYVNFVIADRVSYITLNKVWIKKEDSDVLDPFEKMETVIVKANVFKIDKAKDPNLLIEEIIPE